MNEKNEYDYETLKISLDYDYVAFLYITVLCSPAAIVGFEIQSKCFTPRSPCCAHSFEHLDFVQENQQRKQISVRKRRDYDHLRHVFTSQRQAFKAFCDKEHE